MKTRKIVCLIAAILMTATAAGCHTEVKTSQVSTGSTSESSAADTEDNGELIPKINAKERPYGDMEYDGIRDFMGTIAEGAVKEADTVTNTIDAAEAPAADAPAAAAPKSGDEVYEIYDGDIVPDDFPYEYEPSVQPQAGLLTAGVWNDNDNWGFFSNLVNNRKITIPAQYGLIPTNRTQVTVTDKNSGPVVNAKVKALTDKGEVIWSAVTDKNGVAYLFNIDGAAEIVAESQGKSASASFTNTAPLQDEQTSVKTRNAEISITLDSESKLYEKNEIMFVVDTTGSMGDELMFLQSEFTAIAEEIGTRDTKFSINFYRDEYDEYTTKRYPFSDNIQEINKKLNSEYAAGGGDFPEAVAEVLDETVNDGGWSEESVKLMFMIFDAPPHDGKEQVLESAVKSAAEKGIRIIPVVSSNSERDTELFGRSAAIMTGGTYIFLTDDSGIGYSHLEPIIGEYKVEKLYDIIIRTINEYKQVNNTPVEKPVEQPQVTVSKITDRTLEEDIATDTALEKFFEDEENIYSFGSIKSKYVLVEYSDGTQENVVSALNNGKITIADLDKFKIGYIKQPIL